MVAHERNHWRKSCYKGDQPRNITFELNLELFLFVILATDLLTTLSSAKSSPII